MQIDKKILIIGGYGAVGKVISEKLSNLFLGQVIVAGRNIGKANELAEKLNHKVDAIEFDLNSDFFHLSILNNVGLVIMCIDQKNTGFVHICLKKGIHYIDVTANITYLEKIKLLNKVAKQNKATAILSVGLAPGITNLLVKRCCLNVQAKCIDIFIFLGLGEKHGKAAFQWAFADLNDTFWIHNNGITKKVKCYSDSLICNFPNNIGKRKTYRSNFSDQHTLLQSLNIQSVSTRICFDSKILTAIYVILRKTGISKLLKFKTIQNILIKTLSRYKTGTDQFVLKIEAKENHKKGNIYESFVTGKQQGTCTGLVAAKVAEKLFNTKLLYGVFHIEELIEPLDIINELKGHLYFEEKIST